jgi:hypothetical protein
VIPSEDLDAFISVPHDDGYGNLFWEWPVNGGRQLLRVFMIGEHEYVGLGVWAPGVPLLEDPLYSESTPFRGRPAASAFVRRYRSSGNDEHFVRTVLVGLGSSPGSPS